MFVVYFAKSLRNEKIYVGFTSKDPHLRMEEHNKGSNNWTRLNRPFELIYYESYICEEDARLREKYYKSGFGKKIKYIIASGLDKGD